jgi:hypothetical protein
VRSASHVVLRTAACALRPPPRICPRPQTTLKEERAPYGPGRAPADMLLIVQLSSNSVQCQSGNKDVEAQMRWWQEVWCGEANRALSGVSSKVRELPLVLSLTLIVILVACQLASAP